MIKRLFCCLFVLSVYCYADDSNTAMTDNTVQQDKVLQSKSPSPVDLLNPTNGPQISYDALNYAGMYPIGGKLFIDRAVKVTNVQISSMTASSGTVVNLFVTNINGSAYPPAVTGPYPGTTTNDNAPAGDIGEYTTSATVRSAALPLVNNTPKTIASLSLTAGDWDVRVIASYLASGAVSLTEARAGISLTANSVTGGDVASVPTSNEVTIIQSGSNLIATNDVFTISIPASRVSLATTTTIYFTETQTFSGGTSLSGFGSIVARRVR